MNLHKLNKTKLDNGVKRRGRGYGSGKGGHTTGRGTKGQKARNTVSVGFEGGQVPLYKRLPQLGGFRSTSRKEIKAVPLSVFNIFEDNQTITPQALVDNGIIAKFSRHGVKILASGELTKKVVLNGFIASESAKAAIKKAGATLA